MLLQNLATTTPWGHSPPRDTGRAYRTCSDKEGGFPGGWDSEESACNTGDLASIPGSRKIPWRREWLPRDKQDVSGVMPCDFWVWVLEAKRFLPLSPALGIQAVYSEVDEAPWRSHREVPQLKSQPRANQLPDVLREFGDGSKLQVSRFLTEDPDMVEERQAIPPKACPNS